MNFDSVLNPVLRRNNRFKGLHEGESCFVFCTGSSVKEMDISKFSGLPAIAVNTFFYHKDYDKLDVRYVSIPEPFHFYPFIKNTYNGRYQYNVCGVDCRREAWRRRDIHWFTSVTNLFAGLPINNSYYIHHFGHRAFDINYHDIASKFSFMAGGLYTAIGLAIEMGFKRVYLVGCDYALEPMQSGHFYTMPVPNALKQGPSPYSIFFERIEHLIEIILITAASSKSKLKTVAYEDFTGTKSNYKENDQLVSKAFLSRLNKAYSLEQIVNPIVPSI